MAKVKKGDVLNCEVCGLVMVVDEACGCAAAEILCCEQPMVKGKAAAKKTAAKISKKAAAKATPKKVNAKTSAKTTAKAKPAAKKPARKKK